MDFAWVVDALRRGLKVTRKSWPGQRPQYIRITREPGQETIAFVGPDGQTRRWMCSSIDVLATDWEEYVEPKVRQEGPFVINPLPLTGTMGLHGGKPVEEPDLDEEANKAIALVARNIAENLVELLQNPSVLRLLQKTDIPLSREDINHV